MAEYPRMKELDDKENQLIDREYELRKKEKTGVPDMPFKKNRPMGETWHFAG